jgi:Fe-S-cluster-containing hydrogenase component 2
MQKATVSLAACRPDVCHTCPARHACPTKAIVRPDRDEPAIVDAGRCRGCGVCVPACPWQAVHVQDQ